MNERVQVLINGTEMTRLWRQVQHRDAEPIWLDWVGPSLERWGPYPTAPSDDITKWVPEGYVPILTCSCGDFGCGGACVRVSIERRIVRWSDFTTANGAKPVSLGPFTFDRKQYEDARRSF